MKKRIAILLLIITILASGSLSSYLYYRVHYKPVRVPVASRTLKQRDIITRKDIDYIEMIKDSVGSSMCLKEEEIINKSVRTDNSIPSGSPFFKETIVSREERKDHLIAELSNGEVTYDLMMRDVNVNSAYLTKDMLCDIYATIRRDRIVSDLLVSDCRILALYNVNGNEIFDNEKGATVGTITLAVDKESVVYLNKALASGTLRLSIAEDPYGNRRCHLKKDSLILEMFE